MGEGNLTGFSCSVDMPEKVTYDKNTLTIHLGLVVGLLVVQ